MKLVAVLALLCCLTISVLASPVPEKVETKATASSVKETGRQAAAAAPAAPTSDEDDDDDDDDDVDLDITGDDDDDEEEEDDDEDDDYLERFIEDILGGEDDDEDDDDNAVEAPVVPASPIVQQAAPAPAIPAAVQADLNSVAVEEAADEVSSEASEADTSSYDEETADVVPEGQAVATIQEASVEGADSIATPIVLNQIPAAAAPAASAEDDDDDDEDDDDVDLDITEDDDDDDDEEDDDDDDDDDDVVGDIADARKAREFKGKTKKHTNLRKHARKSATHSSRMLDSQPSADVSAIYVSKYNRFVDNILGRINKILRANYDPVTVKLTNPNSSSKSNKNKSKKKKKSSKRKSDKNGTRKSAPSATTISDKEVGAFRLSTLPKKMEEELEGSTLPDATTTPMMQTTTPSNIGANKRLPEVTTIRPVLTSRGVPNTTSGNKKKNKTKNKNRTKIGTTPTSKPSTSSNNSNKNKSKKNKPKAKATLYGLASLQRSGDVSVNMMSDHTTIKTKFSLGPLMLKVEKEFGRAAKKELRSATATTAEMSGKLSLRVLHGGAATLHSIRVLQPKQVRVESADDHDRTREFVWKRSSHIAHLVSQKLSSATRSMLRPPPVPVPAA